VRRLSKDHHLGADFATRWSEHELDGKTRALLSYAQKLTETPRLIDDADIDALRSAGWDDNGIYAATELIAWYNFNGRLEAASGLPMDAIPSDASFPEATPEG
jgi:alkylhydroperoxidase family enzyme